MWSKASGVHQIHKAAQTDSYNSTGDQFERHELDMWESFMGHDFRIHKEFYRIPEQALQAAKISKLLFGLERGMITSFAGKSLDKVSVIMEDSSLLCRNV